MRSLAVLTLVGCAHAPAAPAASAKAPEGLAFYVGTWACDATEFDDKGVATSHMALEVRVTPDIANWLHIAVLEKGKALTAELKGYDSEHHTYRHLWATEDGAAGTLSSKGWTGNVLVFDEDHPDPSTGMTKMTFTKIDDAHYTHRAEVAGHVQFEKSCHKTG